MTAWLERNAVWILLALAALILIATIIFAPWLNTNSGAVQGGAVAILVLVTAYYAWQTKSQADASVRMAEAQSRPVIVLEYNNWDSNSSTLHITVHNWSIQPALNVTFLIHFPGYKFLKHEYGQPISPGKIIPTFTLSRTDDNLGQAASVYVAANYEGINQQPWHFLLTLKQSAATLNPVHPARSGSGHLTKDDLQKGHVN